ncbi:MAG: response regulator, partial [Lachnospiraceae bacterium]|nr:response regulator [Lachnospiraceae bacterium]
MGKITVAIVDDNVRMQNLMEEILKTDSEIEVVGKAEDGMEALTIIRDKKPDVVLLDLIMPKLDGLGVMERVRKGTEYKKAPAFIVVTAIGQDRVTESAFELGASYYIMKPFDNNIILSRIRQVKGETHGKLVDNQKAPISERAAAYRERNL